MRKFIYISFSLFCILASFIGGCLWFALSYDWITHVATDVRSHVERPSIVFDDEGKELFRFQRDKRQEILFDALSPILIKAFIAAEDHAFFSHHGLSFRGIIRSLLKNIVNRRVVQGASTITQQVARLMYLSFERSWKRKIQELFLALQLERTLTKEQILEKYLNHIYFGRGIYGIAAACKRFWGKKPVEVTVDEAATLAAVAKSARYYSPLNDPDKATIRRNIILRSMLNLGFISDEEFHEYKSKELQINDPLPGDAVLLYIQEWIRKWVEQQWGREALYQSGFRIQTTINRYVQQAAQRAFIEGVEKLRAFYGTNLNGGLLAMEPSTGKIKAVIGGIDFHQSQFNRAFQAVRQTGSSFKPILYAAALQAGMSMDMTCSDESIEIALPDKTIWAPRNWNNRFSGRMTLLKALTTSNNIIAVKTLRTIGFDLVIALAKNCGISRALHPYPSLALGTAEATVEENTAAFNIFANYGVYVKPYLITWVRDRWGRKIWQHTPKKKQILSHVIVSKMVSALSVRMERSRRRLGNKEWFNVQSIGKTGSTNNSASTWFVGATPELTCGVYVGNDDNKGMGRAVYASQTTFPIWLNFYRQLTFARQEFYLDPQLREVCINWDTGELEVSKKSSNIVTILQEVKA